MNGTKVCSQPTIKRCTTFKECFDKIEKEANPTHGGVHEAIREKQRRIAELLSGKKQDDESEKDQFGIPRLDHRIIPSGTGPSRLNDNIIAKLDKRLFPKAAVKHVSFASNTETFQKPKEQTDLSSNTNTQMRRSTDASYRTATSILQNETERVNIEACLQKKLSFKFCSKYNENEIAEASTCDGQRSSADSGFQRSSYGECTKNNNNQKYIYVSTKNVQLNIKPKNYNPSYEEYIIMNNDELYTKFSTSYSIPEINNELTGISSNYNNLNMKPNNNVQQDTNDNTTQIGVYHDLKEDSNTNKKGYFSKERRKRKQKNKKEKGEKKQIFRFFHRKRKEEPEVIHVMDMTDFVNDNELINNETIDDTMDDIMNEYNEDTKEDIVINTKDFHTNEDITDLITTKENPSKSNNKDNRQKLSSIKFNFFLSKLQKKEVPPALPPIPQDEPHKKKFFFFVR